MEPPARPASDTSAAASAGEIVLARHGRPALDRSQKMDWRGYRAWWEAYDQGGLAEGQAPPEALKAIAARADVIFSSTLQRSRETAAWAAPGREVFADADFVEAPLPSPPIPGLRLKPTLWGAVARLTWSFGVSAGQESCAQATERARKAADKAIAASDGGKLVLVCAHGWFNRMMRPQLLARGWACVEDGGDGYWGHRRFLRSA